MDDHFIKIYSNKVKAIIERTPSIIIPNWINECFISFVLWSSGIKSATAIYINPPAAIGINHITELSITFPKTKTIASPKKEMSAEIKFNHNARLFV